MTDEANQSVPNPPGRPARCHHGRQGTLVFGIDGLLSHHGVLDAGSIVRLDPSYSSDPMTTAHARKKGSKQGHKQL